MYVTPNNNFEIVRLNHSMKRRIYTLLYHSYMDEPSFQYILDSNKFGYEQRVRATIRELVNIHFNKEGVVLGVLDKANDVICGVALLIDNKVDLDISSNLIWRLKMYLTTGFKATNNFIDFQNRIRRVIPNEHYKVITLLSIDNHYRHQGLGSRLIQSIHDYCEKDTDCMGIYLDSSNPKYENFYQNMGYKLFKKNRFLSLDESVYLRLNQADLS